ncbi:MAG: amino acid ABC transporter permease, partial [Pseudomonadota bacterium]
AAALIYVFYSGFTNLISNMREAGIPTGFGFLNREAGFSISQTPIEFIQGESTYTRVYFVGLLNTLIVAVVGIFFATILGFVLGVARLSSNWLVARLSTAYVEFFRNIPLLLHIFIWYFGVLRLLPQVRNSIDFGFLGLLNNRGYFAPKPVWGEGALFVLIALGVAIVASIILSNWAHKRQMETGDRFPVFWTSVGMILGLPLLVFLVLGAPLSWDMPEVQGFRPSGGLTIIPELIALLLALVTYTAAFIAEIVRAGILAVNKGQTEAAHALGLRQNINLRLVVIPQALRIIIPPLTSQYLNLTKNSSLAVAIAYPDIVSVFQGTALNQTGLAPQIVAITMLTYLAISLLTSALMNWYNARVALVER